MTSKRTLKTHCQGYVSPDISCIEIETMQILCESDWNDGSIEDNDDNWNALPEL